MPQPHVIILRAPGTNCDRETALAFERAGARTEIVHVNRLLEEPGVLQRFQVLCIPGGFSYGDDIAAGRILAVQLSHHLAEPILRFRDDDKLILGICNGFQTLIKAGVLAMGEDGPAATLTWNDSGRFEDRWVALRTEGSKCVFLRGIRHMVLPVAHAEGKFVPRDEQALGKMEQEGELVLRYAPEDRSVDGPPAAETPPGPLAYPANPNGSVADVAGACDATGRVFGLMPHPERHLDPQHHPRWTRGEAAVAGDGLPVFLNAVSYFD